MIRNYKKYTEVEDTWLLDNVHKYTYPELTKKFNEHFFASRTCASIRSHMINTLGQHRSMNHFYTESEDEWLKAHVASDVSWSELTVRFNDTFHQHVSTDSVTHHCIKILNLHRDNLHVYTNEEDEWIKENIDCGTYEDLVKMFNRKFRTSVTYQSLTSHVLKSMKLNKSINRGSVRKGERRCTNTLPIGAESFDGFNVYVKISNEVNDCKNQRMPSKKHDKNWKRKDYIVLESHGISLPTDSQIVIHLDGDRKNCNIENLYITDKKINLMLSKNNWHSSNPEITLLGIRWCELYYARKEKS